MLTWKNYWDLLPSNLKMASSIPVSKLQEPTTLPELPGTLEVALSSSFRLQRKKRDRDKRTLHRALLGHYCHHHGQWKFITRNFK